LNCHSSVFPLAEAPVTSRPCRLFRLRIVQPIPARIIVPPKSSNRAPEVTTICPNLANHFRNTARCGSTGQSLAPASSPGASKSPKSTRARVSANLVDTRMAFLLGQDSIFGPGWRYFTPKLPPLFFSWKRVGAIQPGSPPCHPARWRLYIQPHRAEPFIPLFHPERLQWLQKGSFCLLRVRKHLQVPHFKRFLRPSLLRPLCFPAAASRGASCFVFEGVTSVPYHMIPDDPQLALTGESYSSDMPNPCRCLRLKSSIRALPLPDPQMVLKIFGMHPQTFRLVRGGRRCAPPEITDARLATRPRRLRRHSSRNRHPQG
jgi:hypothetical protein